MGSTHEDDCVLVKKRIRIRVVIEYEVDEPASWGEKDVESYRNEGSWCANNLIGELEQLTEHAFGCLCNHAEFTYLGDVSAPFLKEM